MIDLNICKNCPHKKPINKNITNNQFIKKCFRKNLCKIAYDSWYNNGNNNNDMSYEDFVIEFKNFKVPKECPFYLEHVIKNEK